MEVPKLTTVSKSNLDGIGSIDSLDFTLLQPVHIDMNAI